MVENPRLKLKSFDKRALMREVCARVQFTAKNLSTTPSLYSVGQTR